MHTITLGRTGLTISRLAFGAGPVSGLMTGDDLALQQATVGCALKVGINWFDTAAGYGNGASERNLGAALAALGAHGAVDVHVATKVRVDCNSSHDVLSQVMVGVEASLARLQRSRVTVLQLHNGVTDERDAEPASVSAADVLGQQGILAALEQVRARGLVQYLGLTGTGHAHALREVIRTGGFDTIQLPYNMLNPSAGWHMPPEFAGRNYGNILADCAERNMGVMAIRVFAAGALLGAPPSAHTLKTPYFPLELYQSDLAHAADLRQHSAAASLSKQALQFALAHPAVHAAIIGFGRPEHVSSAVADLRA